MIWRILDFKSYFFEFFLLLLQISVLLLDVLYLLHIFLQYTLQILDTVLCLLIHGSVFLDVQVVLLQFGLDLLLCSSEIVTHLLLHVRHLLLQLLRLEQ